MRFFKTAAIILVTLAGSFGASQLASGTPLSAGALPLSENVDMSMVSKRLSRNLARVDGRGEV